MSLFSSADLPAFKADRLLAAAQTFFPGVVLSDAYLLQQIQAAEADIARRLKVRLEPTTIFPYAPTEGEISALGAMPWAEEPGYDYDPEFFRGDRWGFIVLRQKPVVSVEFVRMSYPNPTVTFFTIPHDWIRLDKKAGHIRMVPASSGFTAPLSAFIMQAMGGGSTIPFMIQVKYVAGLTGVKTDPAWADLLDVILKQAVLNIIDGSFPTLSGSISADGLSESRSVDPEKYREMVDFKLHGAKGSNGGLFAAIHGISMGVLGSFG